MEDKHILPACAPVGAPLGCQSNPPHRVLVAEDDIFFRQLNTEVLLRAGYAVDAAEDGAAAWEALCADSYDLLITDNSMPRVSGVELLQKLHAARMNLPVIMATGAFPKEELTRQPALQPSAMLIKPYAIEALLRTVKRVLREATSTTGGPQQFMAGDMNGNTSSQGGELASAPLQSQTRLPDHILVEAAR